MNSLVYQILLGFGILCYIITIALNSLQPTLTNPRIVNDPVKRNHAQATTVPNLQIAATIFSWVGAGSFFSGSVAYIISTRNK